MIDRDDKYEGQDDSEYHFSDEEGNYESDVTQKVAPPTSTSNRNPLARLPISRRMYIGLGVFLLAVFISYKWFTPVSNNALPTDITPVAPVVENTKPKQPISEAPPVMAQQLQPSQAAPVVAPVMPAAPSQPPIMAQAPQQQPPAAAPALNVTAPYPPQPAAQVPTAPVATPVAVMPMTPVAPSPAAATSVPTIAIPNLSPANQEKVAALEAENAKLMSQLQAEYAQKIADFSKQSKEMQAQVEALNTRVATMETQFTELLQTLNKQPLSSNTNSSTNINSAVAAVMPETRSPYAVQAIIPGRAWLKSEGGDTITVAEGDMLKGYGRVTKIDPYDGTVLVDTGSKIATLSYGG